MASWLRAILLFSLIALVVSQLSCGGSHRRLGALGQPPLQITQQQPRPQTLGEALALLDEMKPPQGVKPEVFAQLKDALREALERRAATSGPPWSVSQEFPDGGAQVPALQRIVSTPPSGAANAVPDLAFVDNGDGTISLTWSYYNLGDYDQDGIVGLGDIIPLAAHFGEAVPPEDVNSLLAVIDGSGNDKVGIEDITPIAVSFGIEVANYDIQTSPSQAGPFTSAQKVVIGTGLDADTQRMHFAFTLAPTLGHWYRVAPLDSEDAVGEPSNILKAPVIEPSLAAPSNLTAVATSPHDVALSWQDNSTYENGFHVERKQGAFGAWSVVFTASANSTGWTDNDILPYYTYYYRLQAYNDIGFSAYSTEAKAVPQSPASTWTHTWGSAELDFAYSVKTDQNGDIYAAGVSDDNALLLKYSSEGLLLWQKTWGDLHYQEANALCIDNEGAVYVAGHTEDSDEPGLHTFLLKYSADGSLLWQRGYGLEGYLLALTVDNEGNILLAGGEGHLLKCSPTGQLLWQKTWPLIMVSSIETDGSGNIYLAGDSRIDQLYSTCLLKLSADGSTIWTRNWGATGTVTAKALAIDTQGNSYLAGYTNTLEDDSPDIILLKYSTDGTLVWQRRWGTVLSAYPFGICLDKDGMIYVVGKTKTTEPFTDALLLRYSPDGSLLSQDIWGDHHAYGECFVSVSSDIKGYVNIVGGSHSAIYGSWAPVDGSSIQVEGTTADTLIVADDVTGIQGALNKVEASPDGIRDIGNVDAYDALVMRIDVSEWLGKPFAPGNLTADAASSSEIGLTWQDNSSYENGFYIERKTGEFGPWSIVYTASANSSSYTDNELTPSTAYFYRVQAFNDLGVSAYSAEASATTPVDLTPWVHTWGGSNTDSARAVNTDDNGNVYLAGSTSSFELSGSDALLLKFSSDGTLLWRKTWSRSYDYATAIGLDSFGNVYVGGGTRGSEGRDALLLKYSPDGSLLWQKTWASGDNWLSALCVDDEGSIYTTGLTQDIGDELRKAFLFKYSSDGTLLWQKVLSGGFDDWFSALSLDDSGNVFVAGSTYIAAQNYDVSLVKYSSEGTLLWQKTWDGERQEGATSISVDGGGNVYLAGETYSFGGYYEDALLLKYSSDGAFIWAYTWGGSGYAEASALSVDALGNVLVAGSTTTAYEGREDVLLLKYSANGNVIWQKTWGGGFEDAALALKTGNNGLLYVAGCAHDAYGSWTDADGIPYSPSGTEGTPAVIEGVPNGLEGTPAGIEGSPVSIIDTGGGGESDALIMKLDPAEF